MIWTAPALLIVIACALWYYRRRCLLTLRRGRVYTWLMWYVMPYARVSVCHTSMTTEKYLIASALIMDGDIILTTDNRALSTLCVPGDHTHAMLCLNTADVPMCGQMTHDGYGEVSFAEACFHSSRVVILRCPMFDWEYIDVVVNKCRSFKGTAYDTDFSFQNGKSYCSELIYQADVERRLNVVPSRAWGTGQPVVTPDDLAASNVIVIYDSDKPD